MFKSTGCRADQLYHILRYMGKPLNWQATFTAEIFSPSLTSLAYTSFKHWEHGTKLFAQNNAPNFLHPSIYSFFVYRESLIQQSVSQATETSVDLHLQKPALKGQQENAFHQKLCIDFNLKLSSILLEAQSNPQPFPNNLRSVIGKEPLSFSTRDVGPCLL